MKTQHILKLTAGLAAILFAGLVPIHAATTNSVQNIDFELTFFTQGPTNNPSTNVTTVTINKTRVTSKDIIAALGQATGNSFSSKAHLVSVRDATDTNSVRIIEVRDGSNVVDVTSFFGVTATDSNVLSVHSLRFNSATGVGTEVTDGIFLLTLSNGLLTANLNLTGFATSTTTFLKTHNILFSVDEIDAEGSGTGAGTNGVPAVVTGSIEIKGRTLKTE